MYFLILSYYLYHVLKAALASVKNNAKVTIAP